MKNLVLMVRADSQQCLADVLRELPQVRGFTFSHVEGHSLRAGRDPSISARDRVVGYTPHVRVDLLLEDADVDAVLDALADCPCGLAGRATFWAVPVAEHGRL